MIRLYRALLWLYPSGFRREYGEEMCAMFAERVVPARGLSRIGLLIDALRDVVYNAMLLHRDLLRQDLRYTARTMRLAPGFSATVILVTALGVGANTAAFSIADFVLVRPLPFPDPESLVRLCEGPRAGPVGWGCMNELSPANYRDFKEQTKSFAALGVFRRDAVNITDGGEPERIESSVVSPEVLALLRVRPHIGNVFDSSATDEQARTVVISYALWQSRFGGDSRVLGRTVNLDGAPYVVIGVMPAGFNFPAREVQLWTPMQLAAQDFENRGNTYLQGIGRLKPGVTFEEARADLQVVVERLARDYPDTNAETGISFFRLRDEYAPRYKLMLQALCGAGLCILILACANLANLMLARASARERELAVRSALGAGRDRLVRQMITENITLAVLGGAAGVLVARLTFPLLSLMVPSSLPIPSEPNLNLRLLLLAGLFTALTKLGFGLLPALRAGGRAPVTVLRGGRARARRERSRSLLVAVGVAASVVLLVSSGLLIRAMLRVQQTDPGFRADGVLTLRTVLPKPEYLGVDKREQFYQQVLNEVRRLPGVRSAAYTTGLPMVMTGGIAGVRLPDQEQRNRRDGAYAVSRRYVTPQFFATLGIPLMRGRDFEDADARDRRRVAIVSASFARRYGPDEDALGRTFVFSDSLFSVIGIVGDIMVRGLERTSEPQMYLPTTQVGENPLTFYDPKDLVIRTSAASPRSLLPAVRDIIRRVDPSQPISDVRTLADVIELQTAPRAAQARVLLALAILAVLLAGVGIHGVLAYAVAQQRQDNAVRLALGAQPGRIARGVVRYGLTIVTIGMIPGLFAAFAAGRAMSAMLFGVPAVDAMTWSIAITLCLAMGLTGALLPALRALRVSPMTVIRSE